MAATVLIIDDESELRDSLRDVLVEYGFTVYEAGNGATGVVAALQHHPSLVLCDVKMEGLDGYGTVESLRGLPVMASVPIIQMTAYPTAAGRRQSFTTGADQYLAKPFTMLELLRTVKEVLRRPSAA